MAKQAFNFLSLKGQQNKAEKQPSVQATPDAYLHELLRQQKYRQALDEVKKIRRTHPDFELKPPESEIWLRRGVQEFDKDDFKQAENSLRRALALGLSGEVHYWLARSMLSLGRLDAALDFIRDAFNQGSLSKDYSICYLKLLLLKGDTATVEQLIAQKSKQFTAAQLHWTRGVLALKNAEPESALTSFQKIKRPVTPGDVRDAWIAYTQQALENWEAAAPKLGLGMYQMWRSPLTHPILERLATLQQAKTGKPLLSPSDTKQGRQADQDVKHVLLMLQLIEQGNIHDAAHVLLNLGRRAANFAELATLHPALMTLAGQQALTQGQPECAETFWKPLLTEQPFEPKLAVNLLQVLDENASYQEEQQLLTRLLNWLEKAAKQNPQTWPESRLKPTLARLHCQIADTWMAIGRQRTAVNALQQAERLDPQSPEVLGRKGLIAVQEKKYAEAAALLTQSLEGGCRYPEVYIQLLEVWKSLDNKQASAETRRRFGKFFGDLNLDAEIEVAPWVDALSTQSYSLFSHLVQGQKGEPDPAVRACQIFVEAVQGMPTPGGRVSIDQKRVVQRWDELLGSLSGSEQIPVLQAIALSITLFAKREKGIAALINQYALKLSHLISDYPEAREAHLIVLAAKETNPQKLQTPLQSYLDIQPQPGIALAKLQLQVRRFTQTSVLRSFMDEALKREPQNPMLLLAKATTYRVGSQPYEELREQGFELARRVQDANALQAFREEQAFLNSLEVNEILPDPERLENFDQDDMDQILETMIRKLFGKQVPRAELDRMMPQLKAMMRDSMPDFEDEGYEDEMDFDQIFGSKKSKRRRSFRDL